VLVDAANRAGGEDNTSIVVVDVVEVGPADVPVPEAPAPTEAIAVPETAAASAASTPASVHRPAMPPAPEPPAPKPPRVPAASWGSRIRGTLLLFVPLILVLAVAVGGVGYYARRSYYVGFSANRVVIYKGVPGGVLGWDPTVEQRTRLSAVQLTQIDRERVAAGGGRGSLSHAREFVANLQAHVNATSTTTTTTKKPRVTTTTAGRPTTSRARPATVIAP
jgi:protein phosphatase